MLKIISDRTKAHILASITIFIWSTTFVSTKILLNDFSPTEILFFRFVLAYIFLLMIYPHFIECKNKKEELYFAGAGLCGVTLYFIFQNTSLTYTFASNVRVLVSVAPLFTAILSYFLLDKESVYRRFFIGFSVSIIGIILIGFNGNYILKLNPLGDILAITSAAVWAVYSIFMKKISEFNYNVIQSTRKIFMYGIIFLIPLLPLFEFQLNLSRFASIPNLLNMMFLGLGASAICFVTWNYALGTLGPVRLNQYIYLSPIMTILLSATILHENVTFIALIGVVFILAGLYISEGKSLPKFYEKDE